MNKNIFLLLLISIFAYAKAEHYIVNKDILFKTINNKKIKLDLYLPKIKTDKKYPLLVWVHGGAWKRGSKDNIPKKNPLLLNSFLKEGYPLASVDYSLSGEASFPIPLQDINDAINFLYDNKDNYNIRVDKVVLLGRSAGGHLASLIGVTNPYNLELYTKPKYKVISVVSFFGPSDLLALANKEAKKASKKSSVAKFLGTIPSNNIKLAKEASVTTYISKRSPAFILLHGDKDKKVPVTQSIKLKNLLDKYNIQNELYIEKGAKHSAKVFDSEKYVTKIVSFVKKTTNK